MENKFGKGSEVKLNNLPKTKSSNFVEMKLNWINGI